MIYHIKAIRGDKYVMFRRDDWAKDAAPTCERLLELGWTVMITVRRKP